MPNYEDTERLAMFWRENIAEYVCHLVDKQITFGEYLQGFPIKEHAKFFGAPIHHIYNIGWLKKHKDKCVTFVYNAPGEVSAGASPISVIYQMSPDIHVLSNVYYWLDLNQIESQVSNFVVYKDFKNLLSLVDDNKELVKKDKKKSKQVGFFPESV